MIILKNILKTIGLLSLIVFSFFYTEKVITVISEKDPIMIKINDLKDSFKIDEVNAIIDNNTIIPGIYGKEVDIDKSYNNMKKVGLYNEMLYAYKEIKPSISLNDNKDKYIIKGNPNKLNVAIIIKLVNEIKLDEITSKISKKEIPINFFIDYTYLNNNINEVYKLKNSYLYSYGDNGIYTPEVLIFSNNILEHISKKKALFCLSEEDNSKTINLCSNNDMYTIKPNIIGNYDTIKNNLESGSIILLEASSKMIIEFDNIINFINAKGYNIVSLEKLIDEK